MCKVGGLFQSTPMSTVKGGGYTEPVRDVSEAESTGLDGMDEQRKRECVGSMSNCMGHHTLEANRLRAKSLS